MKFGGHIERLEDRELLATFVVTNTHDSGSGSLRQAILNAVANQPSTIAFNIPTSDPGYSGGVFTIKPTSQLPVLNGSTIDGTTQTSFTGDTNPPGPEVVLNGSSQPSGAGLALDDNNTVKGLVINGFPDGGIVLSYDLSSGGTSNNNRMINNYIGTDPTGTSAVPNRGSGILIHGYGSPGVQSSNNLIQNNVISGNGGGVDLSDAGQNQVVGNYIGTDRFGTGALGNGANGIYLGNAGAPRNVIDNNVIAFNGGDGIQDNPDYRYPVAYSPDGHQSNAFRRNSIFSNGGLGINLIPPPPGKPPHTPTPNDPGDGDVGANRLQNTPVLTAAAGDDNTTVIQGTLNSAANTSFTVDLFASPTLDPSGYGEGRTYLGTTTVTTDGSGNASFSVHLATPNLTGQYTTATATDPNNNTSEFSQSVVVAPMPTVKIAGTSLAEGDSGTKTVNFKVTLSAASTLTVTIPFSTADGSAIAGSDYKAISGTLTFAPGVIAQTIAVPIVGDTTSERDETFYVDLGIPTDADLDTPTGTGTILNDDNLLSIGDVSQAEGNVGMTAFTFTVTLSPAASFPVTVKYATANGTATAGSDYTAKSGTLVFAAGETSKTVTVLVNGDTTVEPNDTFKVNLSAPTNATIGKKTGVGTILNDDGLTSQPVSPDNPSPWPDATLTVAPLEPANSSRPRIVFARATPAPPLLGPIADAAVRALVIQDDARPDDLIGLPARDHGMIRRRRP